MLVVGLTGNIASGKSTVAAQLADLGATIIDSDLLAREAVRPGSRALPLIASRWGDGVLEPDGALDRSALRARVFGDSDELEALNSIVHPEVERLRLERVEEAREAGASIVVCDIPLLFEVHLADQFDAIVLVDAPRPVRLERLVRDRNLHQSEAMDMIAAQMPAELKRARSDFVIDNVGDRDMLAARVLDLWQSLSDEAARLTRRRDDGLGERPLVPTHS